MAEHLHSLGASDSGLLNALNGVASGSDRRGIDSRIDGEHVLLVQEGKSGTSPDDRTINALLREVPLPPDLHERLHKIAEER